LPAGTRDYQGNLRKQRGSAAHRADPLIVPPFSGNIRLSDVVSKRRQALLRKQVPSHK